MKENYEKMELEIIVFGSKDIITCSGEENEGPDFP